MFVALDLPEPERSELAVWRDELIAGRSDLRPVAAESLHVTLAFLGWQDESAAEEIASTAFEATGRPAAPVLVPAGVRPLPPRGPRLFALDLADEESRCTELQNAVSRALAAGRFYKPEKRPFWPHVTLARVKRGARAGPLPDLPPPALPMRAAELTLYRSTLRPQGAVYEPLARSRLR
ncbi:MAG TPA: RNA 2',3'-cyclic phosphodiesterase [Thermoleophilaceae bacterium]|nr:RNA 2',3'-cyclic phosphodiesterase [Thermoleophilaceae bacterium]